MLTIFRSSPIKYFTTELSLKGRLKRLLLRKPSTSTFLFLSIKTRLIDWFYFCHFYIMFSKTLTFTSFFYEGGMTHFCLSYYFLMNKASIDILHRHWFNETLIHHWNIIYNITFIFYQHYHHLCINAAKSGYILFLSVSFIPLDLLTIFWIYKLIREI